MIRTILILLTLTLEQKGVKGDRVKGDILTFRIPQGHILIIRFRS